eukprot:TRINITY_DN2382_c0_g1::TRINITY_DN2382_c0_g1_i1::g.20689::m.20689 TRINITY_DN2382_c0_g1::TRINITY_DN2382_c0_g1_i1::g.20689  ORF type:complete len:244 (-),score=5.84,sp/Q8JGR6/NCBP2_DANRE/63.95/1e-64,RRM_1/PF00076.17/2.4e-15,RRM_6/PF14259.1/8.4e-10,RRM_5/PF13893.1/7e-08 TRINITY_DN2382_c0_g1_i1:196-849(-)
MEETPGTPATPNSSLFTPTSVKSAYIDRRSGVDKGEYTKMLKESTTLYIGNLSFYTTEEQIEELFSKCGEVKRIIMGLDRIQKTPCGFCFVIFYDRTSAESAVYFVSGSRLDDRVIRVDWDAGFKEGRQFGRGRSGGQIRDEFRADYDPGRGGFGKQADDRRRFFDGNPGCPQISMAYQIPHNPNQPRRQSFGTPNSNKRPRGEWDDTPRKRQRDEE